MIEFLKEKDIREDTIREIEKRNSDSSLFDLSRNKTNCLKIIDYFKSIHIDNMDELLIYHIDVFKLTFDEMIRKLSRFNIPVFVDAINDDCHVIEELYQGQ